MSEDADRYPTLSADGAAMLRLLKEHPNAPIYRNQSGNRLTREDLARVRAHAAEVEHGLHPPSTEWLASFVERCRAEVPFYRSYPGWTRIEDLPTTARADLSADITRFFPDTVPIERLIHFSTTGTTGHPLVLASHPVVAASYLVFHKRALARFGITLRHGKGQVGVVLIGWQKVCFTYVSVTPLMGESGLAKINLHPDDWRDPDDRAKYLDALQAEVWTGDPISFAELAKLPVHHSPRAMISTSMTLLPGLAAQLAARFSCPVLDLYSLNEVGPVAVRDERLGGHVLLQNRLHVEILDAHGQPVRAGERGEITVTGGFNFCLPLLRYRTGDHASLEQRGGEQVLVGLEGRPPVRFRTASGAWINNIEVTHALKGLPLARFALHQGGDGGLAFRYLGGQEQSAAVATALARLFGTDLFGNTVPIEVTAVAGFGEKVVQYTSALPGAAP